MIKIERIPERNQLPLYMKWSLEDIYQNTEEWDKEYTYISQMLNEVDQNFKGKMSQSSNILLKALEFKSYILQIVNRIYSYAKMRLDEDNRNATSQELFEKAQDLVMKTESSFYFYSPEIVNIPQEMMESYLEKPELKKYEFHIKEIIEQKNHVLSETEERIIAKFEEIALAPSNIYNVISYADQQFPTIKDEQSNEIIVNQNRINKLLVNKNREIRKQAYQAFYSTYANYGNTYASTLHASVKKDVIFSRLLRYNSSLEYSLSENSIPVTVYEQLIDTTNHHLHALHRYMKLRQNILTFDKMYMYDLMVPLVSDNDREISYKEAQNMITQALGVLGPGYTEKINEAFESRWIDAYENMGKTSGAYSWSVFGAHPFILLNWQDNLNSLFTLAHELGHALHAYYSSENQPYLYATSNLFIAEVASTVNEILLIHHLISNSTHPSEKMYLLNYYLDKFRINFFHQTQFAEFERSIHRLVEEGIPLTQEKLRETYHELNKKYYGPAITEDEFISMVWARIPHFYSSFYVYQYATGFAAAISISKQLIEQGSIAFERYLEFLKSGSSDHPLNILKKAGVNLTTAKPIIDTIDVFEKLLDSLEELVDC